MSSASNTPPDDYFNDLSRPTGNNGKNKRQKSPNGENTVVVDTGSGGDSGVPKPKRIACIICRKRKLKCDGTKPSCSTCTRLGHDCAYDEVRRKSGPKRGYVKALEERLSQLPLLPFGTVDIHGYCQEKELTYISCRRASRNTPQNPRPSSQSRYRATKLHPKQCQWSCSSFYTTRRFWRCQPVNRHCGGREQ
jgi:hypothetical protein